MQPRDFMHDDNRVYIDCNVVSEIRARIEQKGEDIPEGKLIGFNTGKHAVVTEISNMTSERHSRVTYVGYWTAGPLGVFLKKYQVSTSDVLLSSSNSFAECSSDKVQALNFYDGRLHPLKVEFFGFSNEPGEEEILRLEDVLISQPLTPSLSEFYRQAVESITPCIAVRDGEILMSLINSPQNIRVSDQNCILSVMLSDEDNKRAATVRDALSIVENYCSNISSDVLPCISWRIELAHFLRTRLSSEFNMRTLRKPSSLLLATSVGAAIVDFFDCDELITLQDGIREPSTAALLVFWMFEEGVQLPAVKIRKGTLDYVFNGVLKTLNRFLLVKLNVDNPKPNKLGEAKGQLAKMLALSMFPISNNCTIHISTDINIEYEHNPFTVIVGEETNDIIYCETPLGLVSIPGRGLDSGLVLTSMMKYMSQYLARRSFEPDVEQRKMVVIPELSASKTIENHVELSLNSSILTNYLCDPSFFIFTRKQGFYIETVRRSNSYATTVFSSTGDTIQIKGSDKTELASSLLERVSGTFTAENQDIEEIETELFNELRDRGYSVKITIVNNKHILIVNNLTYQLGVFGLLEYPQIVLMDENNNPNVFGFDAVAKVMFDVVSYLTSQTDPFPNIGVIRNTICSYVSSKLENGFNVMCSDVSVDKFTINNSDKNIEIKIIEEEDGTLTAEAKDTKNKNNVTFRQCLPLDLADKVANVAMTLSDNPTDKYEASKVQPKMMTLSDLSRTQRTMRPRQMPTQKMTSEPIKDDNVDIVELELGRPQKTKLFITKLGKYFVGIVDDKDPIKANTREMLIQQALKRELGMSETDSSSANNQKSLQAAPTTPRDDTSDDVGVHINQIGQIREYVFESLRESYLFSGEKTNIVSLDERNENGIILNIGEDNYNLNIEQGEGNENKIIGTLVAYFGSPKANKTKLTNHKIEPACVPPFFVYRLLLRLQNGDRQWIVPIKTIIEALYLSMGLNVMISFNTHKFNSLSFSSGDAKYTITFVAGSPISPIIELSSGQGKELIETTLEELVETCRGLMGVGINTTKYKMMNSANYNQKGALQKLSKTYGYQPTVIKKSSLPVRPKTQMQTRTRTISPTSGQKLREARKSNVEIQRLPQHINSAASPKKKYSEIVNALPFETTRTQTNGTSEERYASAHLQRSNDIAWSSIRDSIASGLQESLTGIDNIKFRRKSKIYNEFTVDVNDIRYIINISGAKATPVVTLISNISSYKVETGSLIQIGKRLAEIILEELCCDNIHLVKRKYNTTMTTSIDVISSDSMKRYLSSITPIRQFSTSSESNPLRFSFEVHGSYLLSFTVEYQNATDKWRIIRLKQTENHSWALELSFSGKGFDSLIKVLRKQVTNK